MKKKGKHLEALGPVDMAFYYVESPETPMNIGSVCIFEGKMNFDDLVQFLDTRIAQAPLYQQKIVQAPLKLGPPTWTFDPDFFIENHVFSLHLDEPGTEEQLRQLAGDLVSSMLDRNKPLWEIYHIEGLEGNRTALFFKVHHCMVDGLAAIELFTLLLDLTPEITPVAKKRAYDPPPPPSTNQLLLGALTSDIPNRWRVVKKLGSDIAQIGSVALDKEKRRKALVGVANLINDNLSPIKALPVNGKNTGRIALAWSEFSLAEVRAIKSGTNSSVNDVMLSIFAGAIDKYSKEAGDDSGQDFVRVLVPVSMRVEKEKGSYGNRISVLPIDIPFGISDPLERLQKVTDYTNVMKNSALSNSLDMALTMPSLAPAVAQPLIWNFAPMAFSFVAHTWCTNVAGPQIPVYLMGHQMQHSFGYFPLNPSMGLACVVMSYNQKIAMNLVVDEGIIEDVLELREYLRNTFQSLRRAAKVAEIAPVQIEMRKPEPPPAPPAPPAIEAPGEASTETSASNGVTPQPEVKAAEPPAKMKLFSEEWAQAYKEVINSSAAYKNASTKWEAGSLAFVMQASPRHGYPRPSAVLLDLHKGECRAARSLAPHEVMEEATYVLEGDYDSWMKLLSGQGQPLAMIMRGKLALKKGSMRKLMPFTQSAQELINCAQKVN